MVGGFGIWFGFFVGSAGMDMHKLIHWSCRVFLVPVGHSITALWLGGLQNTTSSEMH